MTDDGGDAAADDRADGRVIGAAAADADGREDDGVGTGPMDVDAVPRLRRSGRARVALQPYTPPENIVVQNKTSTIVGHARARAGVMREAAARSYQAHSAADVLAARARYLGVSPIDYPPARCGDWQRGAHQLDAAVQAPLVHFREPGDLVSVWVTHGVWAHGCVLYRFINDGSDVGGYTTSVSMGLTVRRVGPTVGTRSYYRFTMCAVEVIVLGVRVFLIRENYADRCGLSRAPSPARAQRTQQAQVAAAGQPPPADDFGSLGLPERRVITSRDSRVSIEAMKRHKRVCGTAQTQQRKVLTEQQNGVRARRTAEARRLANEAQPLVHLREGAVRGLSLTSPLLECVCLELAGVCFADSVEPGARAGTARI
ncbi:hypothetical protein T492DRAFT_1149095 [Pavlovales sp. CCMP2436]|nr:hypothetical protein T492DRAFT_1149095 [Pavlovales sp. CCMP2436]